MANQEQNMPFIKNLASSDRKLRTAALTSLRTFLTAHKTITDLEALKLWKGLFFALWMCDRPIPQQNLCTELADLIFALHDDAVIPWLGGFWGTMSKQWTEIDVLRMEKFLLLVRRVFGASLRWVKGHSWEAASADGVMELLESWPFEAEGDRGKVPVGLRLHSLDVWIDEAERAGMLKESGDELALDFLTRMSKLVEALKRSPIKSVRAKATDSLTDERLPWNDKVAEEEEEEDDEAEEAWGGIED